MNQQPPPESLSRQIIGYGHLLLYFIHSVGMTTQVFTRIPGTMGRYHWGWGPWIGWGALLLFAGHNEHLPNSVYALTFLRLGIVMLFIHRIIRGWRERHGEHIHSYLVGRNWFEVIPIVRHFSNSSQEMLIGVMSGVVLGYFQLPLLMFWCIISGVCNSFVDQYLENRDKKHLRDLQDAQYERRLWEARYQHLFEED